MKTVKLVRQIETPSYITGVIFAGGLDGVDVGSNTFYTLERPWLDNKPYESCIPTGEYDCHMDESPKFGLRYHVLGTEPRTHILIHPGNYVNDTAGCILLGMNEGESWDESRDRTMPTLFKSKKAVDAFEQALAREPFRLVISRIDTSAA